MTPRLIGRFLILALTVAILLGATVLVVPAASQLVVALLSLPLGAYLLATVTSGS